MTVFVPMCFGGMTTSSIYEYSHVYGSWLVYETAHPSINDENSPFGSKAETNAQRLFPLFARLPYFPTLNFCTSSLPAGGCQGDQVESFS
jgi:hypothetical protein